MSTIAKTPEPPYYAVIFVSTRTPSDDDGYTKMAQQMEILAAQQSGFLGLETARTQLGITVSYWESTAAIRAWKQQVDHQLAQKLGRDQWYSAYRIRIAKVEREYGFENPDFFAL